MRSQLSTQLAQLFLSSSLCLKRLSANNGYSKLIILTLAKKGGRMPKATVQEIPVVWIQTGSCTGCSVSVLNSVSPTIKNVIIDEVVPGKHISLKFQATVMAGEGDAVIHVLEDTPKTNKNGYVLVVEGAIPTKDGGAYGSLGEKNDKPVPMADRVEALARDALAIIALGTCATFGGIAAGKPNPGGYVGADKFLKSRGINKPLINIAGCPPHPDWFIGTVASVLLLGFPQTGSKRGGI